MFDTQMEPSIARDMIKGAADPLVSAFQLRYSQLLQLARTEGTTAEMLLQVRPHIQFHVQLPWLPRWR
jgi:ATP-dependent RNA helicase DOB1